MLRIKNLTYSYSKKFSLIEDFNMSLVPGSVCGLLGKNGAGKTTLIYLICGLLKPQGGSIYFKGFSPYKRDTGFLQDVFLVPEEFTLPSVTLSEYVKVNAPFYPKFDREQLMHYLEIFELTPDLHLGKLSMGQKKKVFISVAMASNTSLLLLDEPTNGLDITSKRNFRRAVAECMTDDKSILISTHQIYDVEKILDHVIIADRHGVLLNSSINEIMDKLTFSFTTDSDRAKNALIALEVPGGYNIAEPKTSETIDTDVNLETLFELVQAKRNIRNLQ